MPIIGVNEQIGLQPSILTILKSKNIVIFHDFNDLQVDFLSQALVTKWSTFCIGMGYKCFFKKFLLEYKVFWGNVLVLWRAPYQAFHSVGLLGPTDFMKYRILQEGKTEMASKIHKTTQSCVKSDSKLVCSNDR